MKGKQGKHQCNLLLVALILERELFLIPSLQFPATFQCFHVSVAMVYLLIQKLLYCCLPFMFSLALQDDWDRYSPGITSPQGTWSWARADCIFQTSSLTMKSMYFRRVLGNECQNIQTPYPPNSQKLHQP